MQQEKTQAERDLAEAAENLRAAEKHLEWEEQLYLASGRHNWGPVQSAQAQCSRRSLDFKLCERVVAEERAERERQRRETVSQALEEARTRADVKALDASFASDFEKIVEADRAIWRARESILEKIAKRNAAQAEAIKLALSIGLPIGDDAFKEVSERRAVQACFRLVEQDRLDRGDAGETLEPWLSIGSYNDE